MAKQHLYEVDLMRAFIMFFVVCVHITIVFMTTVPVQSPSYLGFGAILTSLHFTRESFMFITGIVLLLTYYGRPFRIMDFWKKRFMLIGIPYLVWTFAYILFKGLYYQPNHYWDPAALLSNTLHSVFTGSQYYLYFLFVSMQMYLLFPLLVKGLQRFRRYHVHIFIGSFVFQVLLMGIYKFYIADMPTTSMPAALLAFKQHAGQFILMYQFWFIGGGITACHYPAVRAWVVRHARWVTTVLILSVLGVWAHYLRDMMLLGRDESVAEMIFQPMMIPYSLIVTIATLVAGCAFAARRLQPNWQWFSRFVTLASNTSFGILLIQPILIVFVEALVGALNTMGISKWLNYSLWPVSILAVYFASMALSSWLGKVPVLSYVVGRKTQRQRFHGGLSSI